MTLETTPEQREGAIRRTREFGESCLAGGRFAASLAKDVNTLLVELQQMTEARDTLRAGLTVCENTLKEFSLKLVESEQHVSALRLALVKALPAAAETPWDTLFKRDGLLAPGIPLPTAYEGCTCACHREPGIVHYFPCCRPPASG